MTLIEALTAKRPEDGKVADWANSPTMGEYAFSHDGFLEGRPSADKLFMPHLAIITSTDFTPVWETPAPMVPKPGEVWRSKAGYDGWFFTDVEARQCVIYSSGGVWLYYGDAIPGGIDNWRLIYSPDPERMRRAQGCQ